LVDSGGSVDERLTQQLSIAEDFNELKELVWARKLPRQVDTSKVDFTGVSGLGKNVRGGTWPRL